MGLGILFCQNKRHVTFQIIGKPDWSNGEGVAAKSVYGLWIAPEEMVGPGEVFGREKVENEMMGGGVPGPVNRCEKGIIRTSVDGTRDGNDVAGGEEAERVGNEVLADDLEPLCLNGVGEFGDGFDPDVFGGAAADQLQKVVQITPPAADVQHGTVLEVDRPGKCVKADELCDGGGPKQGWKAVAVNTGCVEIRLKVTRYASHG